MMFIPNLLSTESGSESIVRARIVIVEDEPDLRDAVAEYLGASGYDVATAESAAAARSLVETQSFHLAILDIAMPGEDGLSLGRWLRSKLPIGIIYATAAGTAIDRIVGLELGADDYMVKPFSPKELVARIGALLRRVRRGPADGETVLRYGSVVIDGERHVVMDGEREVRLTAKEYLLLRYFLEHRGRVLSRDLLLSDVWGYQYTGGTRTVDVHVRRLREKLPVLVQAVETIKQFGYKLKVDGPDGEAS